MSLLIQDAPVAKKKHGGTRDGAGRPKTGRDDQAVKIDRAIAMMAKAIATARGITVGEYLSAKFDGAVRKDYAAMLRDSESKD